MILNNLDKSKTLSTQNLQEQPVRAGQTIIKGLPELAVQYANPHFAVQIPPNGRQRSADGIGVVSDPDQNGLNSRENRHELRKGFSFNVRERQSQTIIPCNSKFNETFANSLNHHSVRFQKSRESLLTLQLIWEPPLKSVVHEKRYPRVHELHFAL
jgi:hypothetical protein